MYIITADYKGRRVTRIAYSDFQAWTIVNVLSRDGCTDIGMREEDKYPDYDIYGDAVQHWD